jgi:hypothetical protein
MKVLCASSATPTTMLNLELIFPEMGLPSAGKLHLIPSVSGP